MKGEVHKRPINSINQLKHRIRAAVRMVTTAMLASTWRELISRHQLLRDNGGSPIELY